MEIKSVYDKSFKRFGKVIEGIDFTEFIKVLATKPMPEGRTVYVQKDADLEATEAAKELCESFYGGLPIEVGYCNGNNHKLNGLEYHRCAEINVAERDMILLLADLRDVADDFTLDTSLVEAYKVPAGVAVEVYATTLHYAPCNALPEGFRAAIVLADGTNAPLSVKPSRTPEDRLLMAENKWLIAHKDGNQKPESFKGLIGPNL